MKKMTMIILAFCAPTVVAATEVVVPDMELGYWVTTADTSSMIEQALAAIPEASREMVRNMMKEKMKDSATSKQCITKESMSSFDEQMKEAFAENSSCKFDITESTKSKFSATVSCEGTTSHITTKFVSSKRNESTITSSVPGMGETIITSVSEWTSSTCPGGA
jgi:uncharacterized membrane protein YhiD involved in acid resistance